MLSSGKKLSISLLVMPASILLLAVNGWFGLGFLIGLILSILYGFDFASELRAISKPSKFQKFLIVLLLFPQAIFGLLSFLIGLAIAVWVIYNTFVARQPEYSGGFLTFGIAPALLIFGAAAIVSAFKRN
jgi:hypothetical protein